MSGRRVQCSRAAPWRGRTAALRAALTPVLVVVAATVLGVTTSAAPAAATGACPGADGVTLVVDASAVGGPVQVRCAPGDPGSGMAALAAAGFAVEEVATQPGFVCRIDGRPTDADCQRTPPADAYWGYWHADRGGSWTYSRVGASSFDPAPGTVEGWAFTAGTSGPVAPGVAPPAPAPPPPAPPPSPSPTPAPRPTASTSPAPPPPQPSSDPDASEDAGGDDVGPAGATGGSSGGARGGRADGDGPADDVDQATATDDRQAAVDDPSSRSGTDASPTTDPDGARTMPTAPSPAAAGSTDESPASAPDRDVDDPSSAADDASAQELAATPASDEAGGSWGPTLVTLALLALLGAGAVVASRRRGHGAMADAEPDGPAR